MYNVVLGICRLIIFWLDGNKSFWKLWGIKFGYINIKFFGDVFDLLFLLLKVIVFNILSLS